jgi:hypothetical protein
MAQTLRTILTIDMKGFRRGLNRARHSVKAFGRDIVAPFGDAIRKLSRLGLIAAGIGAAFAAMGMKAAGSIEQLKLRMKAMSSSGEDFKKTWKTAFDLFVRSPLELEETVAATTLLKAYGIEGKKAVTNVASAAVMMGRNVQDMVQVLGSLEVEPLRRLGIESKRVGKNFTFEFRDKAGKQIRMFAHGVNNARQKLVEIMGIKFGGGIEAAAQTWNGVLSTLRGTKTAVLADLFKPLTNRLAPQIYKINDALIKMMEEGKFLKFGARIRDTTLGVMSYIKDLASAVREFVKTGGENLRTFAIGFALVALAFKVGLVKPMLQATWMLAKGMIAAFQSIMFWKVALVAGLALLTKVVASALGRMEVNGETFGEAFKAEWKQMGDDIKSVLAAGVDAVIPGDVREFVKDIKDAEFTLPDWPDAPEFNWDGVGAGVEDGVVRGMRRAMDEWGRLYMGDGGQKSRIQEFRESRDSDLRGLRARQAKAFPKPMDLSGIEKGQESGFRAALTLNNKDIEGIRNAIPREFVTPELKGIQKQFDADRSGKELAEAQKQNTTLTSIHRELQARPSVTW